jgi:hypothetical protein
MQRRDSTQVARVCALVSVTCLVAGSVGCSFALPVPSPPTQERVRVLAASPERYTLRLNSSRSQDFPVSPDGKVTLDVPPFRRGCTVHFLGIKTSDGYDPLKKWTVTVNAAGKTVRSISLSQVAKLPTDAEGFRMLKVANNLDAR